MEATEDLTELVQFIFRHETVPGGMAVGGFAMLWGGKGVRIYDMAQYRAVCLEEAGLKLAASMMLARLSVGVGEPQAQRPEAQGGLGGSKESPSQGGLFANRTGLRRPKYLLIVNTIQIEYILYSKTI